MSEHHIPDPEFQLLVSIATSLESDYLSQDDGWAASPFDWIRQRPSRTKGKIGEQLVAGWCAAKGFDVMRAPNPESDRVIGGLLTEIKFSILWESGDFAFQQLRDQRYDIAICLGLSPHAAHCWVVPKDVLWEQPDGVRPQHRGQEGTDTKWLHVNPDNVPAWLDEWGGSLADAYAALHRLATANSGRMP